MSTQEFIRFRRALLFLALLTGTCCRPSFAAFDGADKGTSAAQFLKLGAGARAAGMGEAYSAVCADAGAVYWNPGALGSLKGVSGTFTHTDLFGALAYEYLGYAAARCGGNFKRRYLSVPDHGFYGRDILTTSNCSGFRGGGPRGE